MPAGPDQDHRRTGLREPCGSEVPTVHVSSDRLTVHLAPTATVQVRRIDGRCTVRLGFGRSGVGPDVSVQPGAVVAVVDQHARFADADPNRWRITIVRALRQWERSLDWCPIEPDRLAAAVGALTHPLLAPIYALGAAPLGDIPRWAAPILRSTTPEQAARELAGESATRRLARATARSLVPVAGRVDLAPLSLAVAASGLVGVDHLANLLTLGVRDEGLPRPLPSVDQVAALRRGLAVYAPDRRARLLVDALDDPPRLADALAKLVWVEHRAPRPLPIRVDGVVELCGRLVPVLAAPSPSPPSTAGEVPIAVATPASTARDRVPATGAVATPRASAPRAPAPPARRAGRRPLHPPAAPRHAPQRWEVPGPLRSVSGLRRDGLTFVVPTSAAELQWWSRELDNCLDTFVPAAAHERSWLIGIRRDDDLVGCVEVCPQTRRLRQAQGPRNRALPDRVYDVAISTLAEHGILRVHRTS